MKNKKSIDMSNILSIFFVAIFAFGFSIKVFAESLKVPDLFNNGPIATTSIKLQANEISSLMLLESIADVSSSAVLASGCKSVEGKYPIEISADGIINKPETNIAKIASPGSSEPLVLNATMEAPDSFYGQNIKIRQAKNSKLKETLISDYSGVATVNRELTLLSMYSNAKIPGQNNILSPHQNLLIKSFYDEKNDDSKNNYILGWGAASLSKENYPVNLFWVQFKALKASGQLKRAVLQQDLLIGTSSCRILADTATETKSGNEKEELSKVLLKGVLTISTSPDHKKDSVGFEF